MASNFSTPSGSGDEGQLLALPLNLVAMILSHLDNAGDLARIVQTCRVLRYMALPQLYNSVHLYAYPEIRYVDGRPEGFGNSSPFSAALNTLVSRNVVSIVRNFSLSGHVKEYDLEEFAKAGRVSDSSMILNSLVRCAIDRMPNLESFSWNLNVKLYQTVYEGLTGRSNLKSITVRFPSTRAARPTMLLPGFPVLEMLKVTHIDPLCFPDDISLLLLKSPKLQDLRLAWSPRMRLESEPSVDLHTYFGRCVRGRHRMRLKRVAFAHLYSSFNMDFNDFLDTVDLESVTVLNSPGGPDQDRANVFLDSTWKAQGDYAKPNWDKMKTLRFNSFYAPVLDYLFSLASGLRRLYFVNASSETSSYSSPSSWNSSTPSTGMLMPASTPPPAQDSATQPVMLQKDEYMYAIKTKHGSSLRHLLLPVQWVLSATEIRSLAKRCPNIDQLALTLETGRGVWDKKGQHTMLHEVLKGFPKLFALRGMHRPQSSSSSSSDSTGRDWTPLDDAMYRAVIGNELTACGCKQLKWVALGPRTLRCERVSTGPEPGGWKYVVTTVSEDAVKDIEIWSMDSLEL